ncbi:MAG: glutamine--tRNA ligase [Bacteroidetes bacterium]|nr:MAG: glutamine--tRNA ligase [Bacteroidota bacterium]
MEESNSKSLNFIEQIIDNDLKEGKNENRIHTRFPPEPNGYLHIGHAKSICLNFGLGEQYKGKTNLRFDDTNPSKEDDEYVNSIIEDIKWLGFNWEGDIHYTSDYFDQLYTWACDFIKKGLAYVDEQSSEQMREQRGTPQVPATPSPFRNRTIKENLELFSKMKNGEFEDGSMVLRAKIDLSSPNMQMRDPVMYRIMRAHHHRTGNDWSIYPMYDFAHGQSDYIENITHSICTLEFENHRPLYDWYLDQIAGDVDRTRQIEFARLNINYTVMSKRKLMQLVDENIVNGWDDPRMPTISGLRRRGFTPESIRNFADRIGVAKRDNIIEYSLLEFMVREHLNKITDRVMAVIDPIKLTITNFDEDKFEDCELVNNPEDENSGKRNIPFGRNLFIERSDFMIDAPKKFFRLAPGREVRLKGAFIIKCEDYITDSEGNITEILCTYDPETKSGSGISRKVKGVLHWVSAEKAIDAEIRLYDRLFNDEDPLGHEDIDFKEFINPNSLQIIKNCKLEPSLADAKIEDKFQFQRTGYFTVDKDSKPGKMVFNRTVALRDSWAKNKKR